MNQAQFSDLDDEIIADDWLVPRQEISRRRLFKRTPKYDIYKADWFGDVLVYEPSSRISPLRPGGQSPWAPASEELAAEKVRTEELRLRLANLDLDIHHRQHNAIPIRKPQSSIADSEQADSAYSSISSTPHYHSKNLKSEFEFPHQAAPSCSPSFSSTTATTTSVDQVNSHAGSPTNSQHSIDSTKSKTPSRVPVILNKDSYLLATGHSNPNDAQAEQRSGNSSSSSTWQELNELRLIAHEGFMLFMGASVEDECYSTSLGVASHGSSTSLVMQINHPKAVSLRDLLRRQPHQQLKSPIDRFLTARQYFGAAAKLNICQQIRDAMTYLHGKNIVHARLSSVNIYIEPNQAVKISLIDNDERPLASLSSVDHSLEFNAPALAYLSPELMRTLKVVPLDEREPETTLVQVVDGSRLTKRSDVFAFGTIVYELFHERLPFERLPAAEVIYRIGLGQTEPIKESSDCPALVKQTISACWSTNPQDRPDFRDLRFDEKN